jgi:CubicO group peptidase (beta-lactamase class C family)
VRLLQSVPLLLLLAAPTGAGAELPLPSLRRYFASYDRGERPGAAVLVMRNGGVLHQQGYGLADLERRQPITPRTAFDLASLSKQFTALGIAMLAEQGKLSYDDPVGRHLPELPTYARKVTLGQLIHHTSGLPEYLDLKLTPARGKPRPPRTNREVVALLKQQKGLVAPPGARHAYNNTGYVLLAQVIAKVSGLSYGEFMRRRVFEPLGMKQSFIEGQAAPGPVALGYRRVPALQRYGLAREATAGNIVGDGGIHSSLEDMQRWTRALENGTLVRPATLRRVLSKGTTRAGKPVNYGFGWWFERHGGHEVAVHTGNWRGFKNVMAYVPEKKLWVIVLGNSGGATPRRLLRPWLRSYLTPRR